MSVTTELEAVNTMLSALQGTPVNSLTGPMSNDLRVAIDVLAEIRRAVCLVGWQFNAETKFVFSPDGVTSQIVIPDDVISMDVTPGYNTSVDVVQRGGLLYDKKNHTYTFDADLTCDIVKLLPWDALPEAARRYVMIRAARVLVGRLGEKGEAEPTRDEKEALADLRKFEAATGDLNFLTTSSVGKARRPSVIDRLS